MSLFFGNSVSSTVHTHKFMALNSMEAIKTKKASTKNKLPPGQVPVAPTLDELLISDEENPTTSSAIEPQNGTCGIGEQESASKPSTADGEISTQNEASAGLTQKSDNCVGEVRLVTSEKAGQSAESARSENDHCCGRINLASAQKKEGSEENKQHTMPEPPRISIEHPQEASELCYYPRLSTTAEVAPTRAQLMAAESGESELLSEQQLLEYYQNEQLEFVDDFVDVFVQQEIEPRNSLYELLLAYKEACERVQSNEDVKAKTVEELRAANNQVWTVTEQRVLHQGKCGCERSASGEVFYKTAELHPEQLVLLKEALDTLTECELDTGMCGEVRVRALALQLQWAVLELRERFLVEHQLQPGLAPILVTTGASSKPSRRALRGALSDLFHFLRFPMLPVRYRDSLIAWISELSAVLLKACTGDDQCFLLCNLLRTPSPIASWGASLVQTFVNVPALDQRHAMNNFVALLSTLMQPIRHRDQFMVRVTKYYEGDEAWNVVSEEGDEVDSTTIAELTEGDLVELLSQFPIRPLLNLAFRHFTLLHQGSRVPILYSLVSFVLILLKILNEGLQTHAAHKNLSKKIADCINKIVHFFCAYWELTRTELEQDCRALVQNEVNRIVLQAVYYLVSKKNAGIRQFLVDFPFDIVSESCRLRCQLLLRSPPTRQTPTVRALYEIPDAELVQRVKSGGSFVDQMGGVARGSDDLTYTVSALAAVVSRSELDVHHFVTELIDICFLNENSRDDFYKVGSEAMGVLIERNPSLLTVVLRYIDRHVDHLDEYAANILANVPLHVCTMSAADISDRLGKWLINRPVGHPASAIARRVLSSLNWSARATAAPGEESKMAYSPPPKKLWIPVEVHDACAETLVKAHIVQCKSRNSLIAKSVNKAARLAMKCPDMEQQFDKFCWDVLLRLKISERPTAPEPPNDLTAFYVHSIQKCLSTPNAFMESGLRLFQELVNASCFNASVILLSRLVHAHPTQNAIRLFTSNPTFCVCLERLIHADESAYALQLLMGADKFPGPVLSLISSSIVHQLVVDANSPSASSNNNLAVRRTQLALAWLQLLTCQKKMYEWNADKFILHLVGEVARCAIVYDPQEMFGAVEMLKNVHKAQCQTWRDKSRGPLSWFSSHVHPPLIASSLFAVSPWATFLLLRADAEQASFPEFNAQLNAESISADEEQSNRHLPDSASAQTNDALLKAIGKMLISGYDNIWAEFVDMAHVRAENERSARHFAQYCHMADSPSANTSPHHRTTTPHYSTLTQFFSALDSATSSSPSRRTSLISDGTAPFPSVPAHRNLPQHDRVELTGFGPFGAGTASSGALVKFKTYLDELNRATKAFLSTRENVDARNIKYLELFQSLYRESQQQLHAVLQCGSLLSNRCPRPALCNLTVTASEYSQEVATKMNENRREREEELSKLFAQSDALAIASARLEYISSELRNFHDAEKNGDQFQFHSLMPVMFENLVSVTSANALQQQLHFPLGEICMRHFVQAMFHRFPYNLAEGLRLALSGCDKNCVPAELLCEISRRLDIDAVLAETDFVSSRRSPTSSRKSGANSDVISAEKARECFQLIAQQLASSRRELSTRLFAVWSPYLERVCALADFFLRANVRATFRADASTSTMETELTRAFRNAQSCWAPLLEPVPVSNLAPWSVAEQPLASSVLDRLIRYLLWLPFTLYIPPGSESPEALFWQYFAQRLVGDELRGNNAQGLKHIHAVYENKLIALNWTRFWPTLIDLDHMDRLLSSHGAKAADVVGMAQIVAELLVRLPWPQIIHQYQKGFQPEQARREFHSLLLSIFAKCVIRRENYTRSRASMCSLLKLLHDQCAWAFVKAVTVERVGTLLSDSFPSSEEWFNNAGGSASSGIATTAGLDEAQQCWQSIWRLTCHISTLPVPTPKGLPGDELARKRTVYIRTQLRLLFRQSSNDIERADQLRYYSDALAKANFVLVGANDKADYLDMAREFVAVWADHVNNSVNGGAQAKKCRATVDAFYARLIEWLSDNPDSPLVLLLASTALQALANAPLDMQRQLGIGLLEACINAYFKRSGGTSEWREISQWTHVPVAAQEWLYSAQEPHFLALNAHLMREMAALSSPAEEQKLLKRLAEFLASIKPKHVTNNEPAFLLCVEKWQCMCIRLFTANGIPLAEAHEQLDAYLGWLHRVYAEEGKGGSLFSMVTRLGRKPTYSNRLHILTAVVHAFVSQQLTAPSQAPRLQSGQHVLNSRRSAFLKLRDHKANQEFGEALADVTHYFSHPADTCLGHTPELFRRLVQLLYPTHLDGNLQSIFRP